MYQPAAHRIEDVEAMRAFIRANPLALLITQGADGLTANPLPFLLVDGLDGAMLLRAHTARANPQWRELDGSREAIVAFQDPGVYVTPSWYATKKETGKVVPTWNYVSVQARGKPRAIDDRTWLRALVDALTDEHERDRSTPWAPADAPVDYLDQMLGAIIGVEMVVDAIVGKWKVSQNRVERDRDGVVAGLRAEADEKASRMAERVARPPSR